MTYRYSCLSMTAKPLFSQAADDPNSTKKGSISRRKSGGSQVRGPSASKATVNLIHITFKDDTRLLKRKEQNRAAQRAFRERKEKHVKDVSQLIHFVALAHGPVFSWRIKWLLSRQRIRTR